MAGRFTTLFVTMTTGKTQDFSKRVRVVSLRNERYRAVRRLHSVGGSAPVNFGRQTQKRRQRRLGEAWSLLAVL